jgi:hypothetical protein
MHQEPERKRNELKRNETFSHDLFGIDGITSGFWIGIASACACGKCLVLDGGLCICLVFRSLWLIMGMIPGDGMGVYDIGLLATSGIYSLEIKMVLLEMVCGIVSGG